MSHLETGDPNQSENNKKKSFKETFRREYRENESMSYTTHATVLTDLLKEVTKLDMYELAARYGIPKIERKHEIQIVVKEVLRLAGLKKWSLCIHNGAAFVYNGAYWEEIGKEELRDFLGKAAIKMGIPELDAGYYMFRLDLEKQFISEAFLAKPNTPDDQVLINLSNGTLVINPMGRELKEFDKDDFLTYQLKFELNARARCPMFDAYLAKVLPDITQQKVLAEFIAYVFIKHSSLKLEKALVLFGYGANGKSVFFEIMSALLGPENVSSYSLYSLTHESGYYRSKIGNKLLNYASEISPKMDSTIFKQLVSGEPVEARLPHKEPCILRDYAKLIFNTNELPKDIEHNEAFFRRFIIVNFSVTIPEEERDPELAKKIIETELPGVLNWVMDGLQRLLERRKFTYSEEVERAVENYRNQSDSVHLFLSDFGYVPDVKTEKLLKELFKEYKDYCSESGYYACSKRIFSDRLGRRGFVLKRKNFGMVVYTVKKTFSDDAQPTLGTPFDQAV